MRSVSAIRVLMRLIIAVMLFMTLDFFVFSFLRLVDTADDSKPVHSDAIVVFSGDPSRVRRGFELLAQGNAPRLFLAGLDNGTDVDAERAKRPALSACCVDVEHASRNTHEDAQAIAAWAISHGLRSLIVVTTNIHMPRAFIELKEMIPAVQLNAIGVSRGLYDSREWRRNEAIWPQLSRECAYYALVRLKTLLRYAGLEAAAFS